jgi:hypothetical protein
MANFRYVIECGKELTPENVEVESVPPMFMDEIPKLILAYTTDDDHCESYEDAKALIPKVLEFIK